MNVPPYLLDGNFNSATVPTLIGTPPQEIDLTVAVYTGLLAAYGYDCVLCAGPTLFDSSLSETFSSSNTTWSDSIPSYNGTDVNDTVSFGGLFNVVDQGLVYMNDGSKYSDIIWNGLLGLFLNPLNASSISEHIFTHLYQSSSILNPVIGMRFDPANPKLTIGALDPNDYEGTINWVEMSQHPDPNGDYYNTFNVDGVKGYNGTFVPFGGNLTAALDSYSCPGYYGFAFPSGANRTQAQISQTPTSTPTNSAQCLSLIIPTSTPTANVVLASEVLSSNEKYNIYGQPGSFPVSLFGAGDLPQIVWD
ncbi:hypothetical protein PAXINDRAFT_182744 [Paxillus involutus ATCC 200175]|uniref:Peptidase A1 domain-containing protein n=1 Tax=Paxillus involutus ATCC 200175 TaxID=664439 RepID=A0A0C9T481_PAXIN|nr:hypothetical protein PAXINDRAFT_182744 [Paxillus involutus ATCC 200175]